MVKIVNGELGIWFDRRVAACLLSDIEELHLLRQRVNLMDEQLAIRQQKIIGYEQGIESYTDAIEAQRLALRASEDRTQAAQRRLKRSTRGKVLLCIAGFLAGSLATLGIGLAAGG